MKKLEKYNTASEFNKEHLKTAKVDQVVECFPNTLLKLLPNTIQKTKWTKKSKEVENWDIWWSMHEKILQPLRAQAEVIHKWWEFTGKPHPMTIGKVISAHTPKRKKDKPKSIHLVGTDTPEATMIYAGFYTEILSC